MAAASLRFLLVALALAYPLLAHAAAATGDATWMMLAATVLVVLVVAPSRASTNTLVRFGLPVAGLAILAILHRADAHIVLLYLPPVVLNAYMAWMFGHTLAPGRVALLERFARVVHGEHVDPRIPPYARRVTRIWTWLFAALALVNLVLALIATPDGLLERVGMASPFTVSREWWSLFANLLNYVLVGVLFAVEYAYRRWRFRDALPYRDFREFLQRMRAVGPRLWHDLKQEMTS